MIGTTAGPAACSSDKKAAPPKQRSLFVIVDLLEAGLASSAGALLGRARGQEQRSWRAALEGCLAGRLGALGGDRELKVHFGHLLGDLLGEPFAVTLTLLQAA